VALLVAEAYELVLFYRARGLDAEVAAAKAARVLGAPHAPRHRPRPYRGVDEHEAVGIYLGAAADSFCFSPPGRFCPTSWA
jgi:hypothetical protein